MALKSIDVYDSKKEEELVFLYETNLYYFNKSKNHEIIKSSTMFDREVRCDKRECSDDIKYYDYYIENYIEPLLELFGN